MQPLKSGTKESSGTSALFVIMKLVTSYVDSGLFGCGKQARPYSMLFGMYLIKFFSLRKRYCVLKVLS